MYKLQQLTNKWPTKSMPLQCAKTSLQTIIQGVVECETGSFPKYRYISCRNNPYSSALEVQSMLLTKKKNTKSSHRSAQLLWWVL